MRREITDEELDSSKVWNRAEVLQRDEHLIAQVHRVLEPLKLVTGTRDMFDFKSILHDVSLGVAIIEERVANGETRPDPIIGPVTVTYNPASGYDLWVRGATVYSMRIRERRIEPTDG